MHTFETPEQQRIARLEHELVATQARLEILIRALSEEVRDIELRAVCKGLLMVDKGGS